MLAFEFLSAKFFAGIDYERQFIIVNIHLRRYPQTAVCSGSRLSLSVRLCRSKCTRRRPASFAFSRYRAVAAVTSHTVQFLFILRSAPSCALAPGTADGRRLMSPLTGTKWRRVFPPRLPPRPLARLHMHSSTHACSHGRTHAHARHPSAAGRGAAALARTWHTARAWAAAALARSRRP